MLRAALLIVGLVLFGVGVVLQIRHGCGFAFLIWGAIVAIAVLFETWRYRRRVDHSNDGGPWQKTSETFEDIETGETLEVEYNPQTGTRRYVEKGSGKEHRPS